jgi:hypothetical protein
MNSFEKVNNIIEKEPCMKEKVSSYSSKIENNFYNIAINKINESTSKFIFKPYLTSKDKLFFDEELILDNKIKELHRQKTNYLNYQPDLSIKKRFILFDWIMEVASYFHFKRKTYYSCINLIEIFFSKCKVSTHEIQLIGITCLLISAKNEESTLPELSYFTFACNNLYSKTEIINQEIIILKALKWKIQYINLCDIGNLLTVEWDSIMNNVNKDLNDSDKFPKFRNDPEYKNILMDHYFQILDFISLDYFYNFINEKYVCISVIYIIVGVAKKVFLYKDALECFSNIQNYEKVRNYQRFFFNFSKQYFKTNINEIADILKYVCLFCGIKFESSKDIDDNTPEDCNQLQIYNRNNSFNFQKLKEIREFNNINI